MTENGKCWHMDELAIAMRLREEMFKGIDLTGVPHETQILLGQRFASLISQTSMAGASMTVESDVVLIAANEEGQEAHVHASGSVLKRASTGFRGILEETAPTEIRLRKPGDNDQALQPIAAVRWVMEVVHASVARGTVLPASGAASMHVDVPTPPLSILLAACQIADCWDFPAVLSAAASCLHSSVRAQEEDFGTIASCLVKLLHLAHRDDGADISPHLTLRVATEKVLACVVPVSRLGSVLKTFDLEQVCRVINQIQDEIVELKPLTLRGSTALERGWWTDFKPIQSDITHRPSAYGVRLKSARPNMNHHHEGSRAKVQGRYDDAYEAQASQRTAFTFRVQVMPAAQAANTSGADEMGEGRLEVNLYNSDGAAALLEKTSHLWLLDGAGQKTVMTLWPHAGGTHPPRQGIGFANVMGHVITSAMARADATFSVGLKMSDLGSIQIGGTIVISKLQLQYEVLCRWQNVTGRQRISSPSQIVSTFMRLQQDCGAHEVHVGVSLRRVPPSPGWRKTNVQVRLAAVRVRRPQSDDCSPTTVLCESMLQYVCARLEKHHGRVNRAMHQLDFRSIMFVLRSPFYGRHVCTSPQHEMCLFRFALDWVRQPSRTSVEINAVMNQIYFAGLPVEVLLHVSSFSPYCRAYRTHAQRLLALCQDTSLNVKQMVELGLAAKYAFSCGKDDHQNELRRQLVADLNALAENSSLGHAAEDVAFRTLQAHVPSRLSFEEDSSYPDPRKLHEMLMRCAVYEDSNRKRYEFTYKRYESELKKAKSELTEALAQVEAMREAARVGVAASPIHDHSSEEVTTA
jgi:hypothetical protein